MSLLPKSKARVGMNVGNAPQWRVHIPENNIGRALSSLGEGVADLGNSMVKLAIKDQEEADQLELLTYENTINTFATERLTSDVYSLEPGKAQDEAYHKLMNTTLHEESARLLEGKSERVVKRSAVSIAKLKNSSMQDYASVKRADIQKRLKEQNEMRFQKASDTAIATGNYDSFFDYLKDETSMAVARETPLGASASQINAVYEKDVIDKANRFAMRAVAHHLDNNNFESAKIFLGQYGARLGQDVRHELSERVEKHERIETTIAQCKDGDGKIDFTKSEKMIDSFDDYSVDKKNEIKKLVIAQGELYNKRNKMMTQQKCGENAQKILACTDALSANTLNESLRKNATTSEELIANESAMNARWGAENKVIQEKRDQAIKSKKVYDDHLLLTLLGTEFNVNRNDYINMDQYKAYTMFVGRAVVRGYDVSKEKELKTYFDEKVWAPSQEYKLYNQKVSEKLEALGIDTIKYTPYFTMAYDNSTSKGKLTDKQIGELIQSALDRKIYSKDDDRWYTSGTDSAGDMMESGIDPNTFEVPNWQSAKREYYRLWVQDILKLTDETELRVMMSGGVNPKTGKVEIDDDVMKRYFRYKTFGIIEQDVLNKLGENLNLLGKITDKEYESLKNADHQSKQEFILERFKLDTKLNENAKNGFKQLQDEIKKNGGSQVRVETQK